MMRDTMLLAKLVIFLLLPCVQSNEFIPDSTREYLLVKVGGAADGQVLTSTSERRSGGSYYVHTQTYDENDQGQYFQITQESSDCYKLKVLYGAINAGRMLSVHSTDRDNGDSRTLVHVAPWVHEDECWAIETIQSGQYTLGLTKSQRGHIGKTLIATTAYPRTDDTFWVDVTADHYADNLWNIVTKVQMQTESKALTITDADMDYPKRGSNPEHCIRQDDTFAQLSRARGWISVTLEKKSRVDKVELYAANPETDDTTLLGADVYVQTKYCGRVEDKSSFYTVTCTSNEPLLGSVVKVRSRSKHMKLARIVVFGENLEDVDGPDIQEVDYYPTIAPDPTDEPYDVQVILENTQPETTERDDGIQIWVEPEVEEPIPYKVLTEISNMNNATDNPLGYLAFAGYADYSIDIHAEPQSRDSVQQKQRTKFDQKDLDLARDSFIRFNSYVEDGYITDEMIKKMKEERCGNADMVYGSDRDECTEKKVSFRGEILKQVTAFQIPGLGRGAELTSEATSYSVEMDVRFADVRNGRSRSVFLGFNYDEINANGKDTPLEIVALRIRGGKLCSQFLTLAEGRFVDSLVSKKTIVDSCYDLTENDKITHAFKIRLDVYRNIAGIIGKVHVSVKGREIAKNVYKTDLLSSAIVMHRDDHEVTLIRLCKRWALSKGAPKKINKSRRKRFTLSNHRWGTPDNLLRFNFQNYSSSLGQDGTRQGILKALNVYSESTGLSFTEVTPTSRAEIVFMFIKGLHFDNRVFHGAGREKAHAYTPTHSEIHFNDHEEFSSSQGDRKTSMFFVALHEIGHALGIMHSKQQNAVMYAEYPENAFDFTGLHSDDILAVKTNYPEAFGRGSVEKLSTVVAGTRYTPKTPFPRECHSKVDAAVLLGSSAYLVSGSFLWRMHVEKEATGEKWHVSDGYPRSVTDVFQQAYGEVDAIFAIKVPNTENSFKVFVLTAGNLISQYSIMLRNGNAQPFISIDFLRKEISSYFGQVVDRHIKSALVLGDKAILISNDLTCFFEVSWKFNARGVLKPNGVTKNTSMNSLTGNSLNENSLNAVMTIPEDKHQRFYMFATRYVGVGKIMPSSSQKQVFIKVPDHFVIAGWCPTPK